MLALIVNNAYIEKCFSSFSWNDYLLAVKEFQTDTEYFCFRNKKSIDKVVYKSKNYEIILGEKARLVYKNKYIYYIDNSVGIKDRRDLTEFDLKYLKGLEYFDKLITKAHYSYFS